MEKRSINKKLLAVSATLSVLVIAGSAAYYLLWGTSRIEVKFSLKAAIIDSLSENEILRNQTFVDTLTGILKRHNFDVVYYNYNQTKVEFFKKLAEGDYGIIVLRTHAALRKDGLAVDIYTSENYDETKYRDMQNRGLLVRGELNISRVIKKYFAFTSDFIKELRGTFPKSIVIAMGCQTLNQTAGKSMADAFCKKGATVYIGWSSWVLASHSDWETIKLMQRLLDCNETIGQAVGQAHPDRSFIPFSRLDFYPDTPSVRNLKISDLIKETQMSSRLTKYMLSKIFHVSCNRAAPVKRFNSSATTIHSWIRRLSPNNFAVFNFFISSASMASSRTSFIHFSKSPR